MKIQSLILFLFFQFLDDMHYSIKVWIVKGARAQI